MVLTGQECLSVVQWSKVMEFVELFVLARGKPPEHHLLSLHYKIDITIKIYTHTHTHTHTLSMNLASIKSIEFLLANCRPSVLDTSRVSLSILLPTNIFTKSFLVAYISSSLSHVSRFWKLSLELTSYTVHIHIHTHTHTHTHHNIHTIYTHTYTHT